MKPYVPIARRFSLAENQELRDPDYLSHFGFEPDGVFKWSDLFEQTPVVVLGAGRSGKTREFKEQVGTLKTSGQFAFFIPLEHLHDDVLEEALPIEDLESFQEWKRSPTAVSYFFLDALDELKLREGSLRTAVNRLRRACTPHFSRLRLILSCRPADWKSQIDSQYLVPFAVRQNSDSSKVVAEDGEVAFLEVISKSESVRGLNAPGSEVSDAKPKNLITVVTLLPFSRNEIREFSQRYSADHAHAFCAHIEAYDLWHLYRLPAEIVDTLDQMADNEPLGTLEDQLRLGIQRKLREVLPNKRRALSVDRAQEGAERIALALFLLKKRSLKLEDTADSDRLDIGDILTDWTQEEQQELIGKTLFDPSGVGAVRFHHRASQEYLAARRLDHLRQEGMHERDLYALLFSEVGAEDIVKPSLAPVAAWLAIWHPDIRMRVLEREPGLLFRQGLPSALSLGIRAEVLRTYISQYAGKGWCRAGIGHEALKRVVDPRLGSVVRELWEDAYTGHDSRELLLEMIWLAPMSDCSDLALKAVLDVNLESHHRTYASWGVLAAGSPLQKQALAECVLSLTLPQDVIRNILPEMVPKLVSTGELYKLVNGMEVVQNSTHGLDYTIYQSVKSDEISRFDQITLRDQMTDAIWSTRWDDCQMYQADSENGHFQDGLIACCSASIPTGAEDPATWAHALSIAIHFGERHESIFAKTETNAIWTAMESSSNLREAYFWACLDLADELEKRDGDQQRFFSAISENRQSVRYDLEDQSWLLNAAGPEAPNSRRGVALHAIDYYFDLRQDSVLAEKLAARISDKPEWLETLNRIRNPQPIQPQQWEIESKVRKEEQRVAEEQRLTDWLEWRVDILSAPDFHMDGERRLNVLYDAKKIIDQGVDRDSTWGHWDRSIIARTMGEFFLERYYKELAIFWRGTDVQLRSEREPEQRRSYAASWLLALTAVKAEAETIDWATTLSHDEAVRATRIACLELNGFGGYLSTLEEVHPKAVAHVVAEEAYSQLKQLADVGQVEMFHDVLYHGTENIKAAVAARIAPYLSTITSLKREGEKDTMEYAIRIIAEQGSLDECELAMGVLLQQFEQNSNLPTAFALSLLAILDSEAGCRRLLSETANLNTSEDLASAIEAFAAVFGNRHSRRAPDLSAIPENRRAPLLHALVLRAYQAVRREDDTQHEGVYTPDLRDNAQGARSFLLDSLMATKCPETLVILNQLAQHAEFSHMSSRLEQMAHDIAGQISDMKPYPLTAVQAMDRDGAFLPYDNRSLLTAMMTRLDSFEQDILHAEDTPVEALRKLKQETELRRFITYLLRKGDRGVFSFTQEAVVFDEKRTDIRLQPRTMEGYATVELKRETWSVKELEKALRTQLVDQYLRHESCRVGCLLICKAGRKRWRHPDTNAPMTLKEVVSHLNFIARGIMAQRVELQIVVKGIDYSVKVDS